MDLAYRLEYFECRGKGEIHVQHCPSIRDVRLYYNRMSSSQISPTSQAKAILFLSHLSQAQFLQVLLFVTMWRAVPVIYGIMRAATQQKCGQCLLPC